MTNDVDLLRQLPRLRGGSFDAVRGGRHRPGKYPAPRARLRQAKYFAPLTSKLVTDRRGDVGS